MNNQKSIINVDYINIIRENDGQVRFESVVIPKDIELLAELEAMVDNPNRTVIDMQNRMALFFNVNNRRSYNYIYPYSYASSYVDGVSYPQSMTLDEYHNMVTKIEVDLKERNYSSDVYSEKLSGAIRDKKSRYMTAARRYVNAYSYYKQITSFLSDASVKMYSTETIGWSSFSFDISDDVKINVRSNFGYGWSSYFFVNLTYKGIEIHPYSYWVKYYNADKESLMRYTRNYETDSKSWESAFKFVEDVTNKAKDNECAFVKEFILNEVDELMRGLRTIMKMPMDYLTKCYEQRFHKPETNIIGIWHGSDDFGASYNVYKSELAMAVMAEKITGSIDFLSNLKEFAVILPQLNDSIKEIKRMSIDIVPKLLQSISGIQKEIQIRTSLLNAKEAEYDALQCKMKPHVDTIDQMYKDAKNSQMNLPEELRVNVWRYTYESKYREQHEEYDALCKRNNELSTEISGMKSDINKRETFCSRLERCVDIVNNSKENDGTI